MRGRRLGPWVLLLATVGATGCAGNDQRQPLPDWRDGYETATLDGGAPYVMGDVDGGANQPPPDDTFAIRVPEGLTWPMRIGKRKPAGEPCAIEYDPNIGFAPSKKIECIIDVEELDLWVNGLAYDIVVPEGMCSFILHVPYIFENFRVCAGPAEVSYTRHADGTFSDEVNSIEGVPVCPCDHSRLDALAPNGCTGQYTLRAKDATTGEVAVSIHAWGGESQLGKSYYGAGYQQENARFSASGLPMPYYVYVAREAHVEHAVYDGVSDEYPSTVVFANYYDPKDHDGDMPAALKGQYARKDYEAYCLDDAQETIAHISFVVREWNEDKEFEAVRDPDTVGEEPGWDLWTDPIDDIPDWKTLTPGNDTLPGIPVVQQ